MELFAKATRQLLFGLVVVASLALIGVTAKRSVAAYSAVGVAPGVAVTSGCEEESLFALWRFAHDQPVYRDTTAKPYASAYFNWLFYQGYGAIAKVTVKYLGDAAIPSVGRLVTLAGALTGATLLGILGWRLLSPSGLERGLAGAFLGAFCFLGPLPGWWICTMRPDVWAVTLESLGVVWFLLFQRNRPLLSLLGSLVIFYAAWALKPNLIQALLATILYLFSQRRWLHGFALGAGSLCLYALTLWLLGPTYRQALLETSTASDFFLSIAQANTVSAVVRALPLVILCFGAMGVPRSPSTAFASDLTRLALVGLPLAFAMAFLTSAKAGAAPNYFLTTTVLLTLAAIGLNASRASHWPQILAVGVAAGLELALLFGHGRIDLGDQSADLAQRWQIWATAPEPRFSHDLRLNQPWLNPNSPPLVLAYNYPRDRSLHRKFEDDGVGGLITQGYFASLLLPSDTTTNYDGALLVNYERGPTVTGYTLYSRRPTSAPKELP